MKDLELTDYRQYEDGVWRAHKLSMSNVQTKKRTVIDSSTQMLNLSLYTNKRTGKKRPNLTDKQFTTDALTGKR